MIKIHSVVRDILMSEIEAVFALTNGYMNMSSYAYRILPQVKARAKKETTITSIVVALSRLGKELRKERPMIHDVKIKNITTKMPLSEIVYENENQIIKALDSLHKSIRISQEDFFTITIGTGEIDILCSANIADKVIKHFKNSPKFINHGFAAVGVSFGEEVFDTPNVFFSLLSVTARARVNIEELVSTPTELIFIVAEKDFAKTVSLFSALHRETNKK